MKRLKHLTTILLLIILVISCNDVLEPETENRTKAENFIKDRQSAKNAVSAMFALNRRAYCKSGVWLANSDIRSGQIKYGFKYGVDLNRQKLESNLIPENFRSWNNFLAAVNQINYVLENIDNAKENLKDIDHIKGQAYFLRAFSYWYMTKIWGDVPMYTTTLDNKDVVQTEKAKVLEQAMTDAQKAYDLLPLNYKTEDGNNHTSKSVEFSNKMAALALAMRINLDKGDYLKGLEWYSKISDFVDNPFELEVIGEIDEVFDGDSNESIFGFSLGGDDYKGSIYNPYMVNYNGSKLATVPSVDTLNAIYEAGDKRLTKFFKIDDGQAEYLKAKTEFVSVFRLGELYLVAAEFYAMNKEYTKAKELINKIRTRSGATELVSETEKDVWDALKLERRRELFGEGHSFFDYLRWGETNKMKNISAAEVANGKALWPISSECFESNSSIKQNSYWINN